MMEIIEIDGSYGEGGGQLLRYSVALAALLGKKVRVYNVRAKRSNPGLRAQHLTAVKVIAGLIGAKVNGLFIGSSEILVEPAGKPKSGSYEVDIGTAGSVSLLLQAILPVLIAAKGELTLRVKGGTNVKWAPPIQYMQNVLFPLLENFGVKVELKVHRLGYYPQGGGLVEVKATPSYPLTPVSLESRGEFLTIEGISYSSNLPSHVAERQAKAAIEYLKQKGYGEYLREITIDIDTPAVGIGSGIVLWAKFDHGLVGGDSLGEKNKKAETVGREAAEKLVAALKSKALVDSHALDNIIIYMSLAKGRSSVIASGITSHAETALWLCNLLTGSKYAFERLNTAVKVVVDGIGFRP
ncbi:MAG: RNA 3'-terminal phosphate cyclase [Thermofilaceae archaeon]